MKWLDRIPFAILIVIAVLVGLSPFLPEPHLWEKLRMLAGGTLVRPLDVFDLLWHAAPLAVLALKVSRAVAVRRRRTNLPSSTSAQRRDL